MATQAACACRCVDARLDAPHPFHIYARTGGVVLGKVAASSGQGPHMFRDVVPGLSPATNYTAFLAVRWQAQLVATVVAITGILTPDTAAPTFSSVGQVSICTWEPRSACMTHE